MCKSMTKFIGLFNYVFQHQQIMNDVASKKVLKEKHLHYRTSEKLQFACQNVLSQNFGNLSHSDYYQRAHKINSSSRLQV